MIFTAKRQNLDIGWGSGIMGRAIEKLSCTVLEQLDIVRLSKPFAINYGSRRELEKEGV